MLSSESYVGNFLPGKQFDALIVTLEDDGQQHVDLFEQVPHAFELPRLLEKFILTGDDRNISRVYVNGRLVHTRK